MNPGSQVNHPIRGSLGCWRSSHSTVKSGSSRQLTPATRGGNRCETTKTSPTGTGPAEESPTPLLIRRFTLRSSGQRCIKGCASWPGSSPAPTCGVRRNGAAPPRPVRRRQVNPGIEPSPQPARRLRRNARPTRGCLPVPAHTTKLPRKQCLARHYLQPISPGQWTVRPLLREE